MEESPGNGNVALFVDDSNIVTFFGLGYEIKELFDIPASNFGFLYYVYLQEDLNV